MSKNGLTKDNILTVGKDLSYPDSVVDYFSGNMGQPDGGFPEELRKIVLKGQPYLTERPGAVMPPFDFAICTGDASFEACTASMICSSVIAFL